MTETSKLNTQKQDFDPAGWDGWSYQNTAERVPAYAGGVSYVMDTKTVDAFEKRNDAEARKAGLTESTYSVTYGGVYIGIVSAPADGDGAKMERMKFLPPVPMDEALSGDQPPITGRYPRAVFPAEGDHKYAILALVDGNEAQAANFGTSIEVHKIRVHEGARRDSIRIPDDCPCDQEVRKAIAGFHDSFEIPQGEYTIRMEVERIPMVSIRLDGGRPLVSQFLREGPMKNELPVMDVLGNSLNAFTLGDDPSTVRETPLRRSVGRGAKYAEIPSALPVSNGTEGFVGFPQVVLITGRETQETAGLTYVSLRRSESIEEVKANPNQGLVEVQVDRAAKVLSIEIEFKPERIPGPKTRDIADDFRLYSGDTAPMRGIDSFGGGLTRGGGSSYTPAPSVNVGRTELREPKVGPASPTMQVEWDGHVHSFRFCLTNDIN